VSGPLVKVCGMTRSVDVRACRDLGVDLIGFIFHPKSPRCVEPSFAAGVPRGGPLKVGVFVDQSADEVNRIMDLAGLDLAQLHGGQDAEFCRAVGPERVLKALWPESLGSARALEAEAARFAGCCRALLLDAGKSGGGHGRPMDFTILQHAVLKKDWFLAGGLGPETLSAALAACSPSGLDCNSGVEDAPGIKNRNKIAAVLRLVGRNV
jgi:phosphoribosylanthranilate isomerase